jgi:hypothetical protein
MHIEKPLALLNTSGQVISLQKKLNLFNSFVVFIDQNISTQFRIRMNHHLCNPSDNFPDALTELPDSVLLTL